MALVLNLTPLPIGKRSLRERLKVLVVEDNPADQDFLKIILHEQKHPAFEVSTCSLLSDALNRLDREEFDALLLDLTLPDSQGVASYTLVAARFPTVPVIILTGLDDDEVALTAIRNGAEDYILKSGLEGRYISRVIQYGIERKMINTENNSLLVWEQAAKAEAEEAIRARDEFMSIASHELRTPLNSTFLQMQMLDQALTKESGASWNRDLEATALTPQYVLDKVRFCEQQIKRLTSLLDELLDVTRINFGKLNLKRSRVDLGELAQTIVAQLASDLKIKWRVSRPSGPQAIGYWDSIRIEQVITNLLSNAVKYGAGQPIDVIVEADVKTKNAVIKVRDRGQGVPPQLQERIFNRFDRGNLNHSKISGLGLGLYISKKIVEEHGGKIWVESAQHSGSTFFVSLPMLDTARQSTSLTVSAPVLQKNKLILIVEDSMDSLALLKVFLKGEGYQVEAATNGEEALRFLNSTNELPSLIILDLIMPVMDGREFMQHAESDPRLSVIPIVIMSGKTPQESLEASVTQHEMIQKPINVRTLLEITRHYLH